MKRDIYFAKPGMLTASWCCPGHDVFPTDTYNNRRSKRARSRDKKIERRLARHLLNRMIDRDIE